MLTEKVIKFLCDRGCVDLLADEIRSLRKELLRVRQESHVSCWLMDVSGIKTIYPWACDECKVAWAEEII